MLFQACEFSAKGPASMAKECVFKHLGSKKLQADIIKGGLYMCIYIEREICICPEIPDPVCIDIIQAETCDSQMSNCRRREGDVE